MTTTEAAVEFVLRAATRAPSVHDTRPWRFVVAAPHVELHLAAATERRATHRRPFEQDPLVAVTALADRDGVTS